MNQYAKGELIPREPLNCGECFISATDQPCVTVAGVIAARQAEVCLELIDTNNQAATQNLGSIMF